MDKNKFTNMMSQIIILCIVLLVVAGTLWLIFKMFGG